MTQQSNTLSEETCGETCACHSHQINNPAPVTVLPVSFSPMAGPFSATDFASLVPVDKKLRPDWVDSLYARGTPTVYSKKRGELDFIGMPVGGLCCGTVYLGGDGRLWVWDIFNQTHMGVLLGNVDAKNGSNYYAPLREEAPFSQGFALKVDGMVRRMEASDWDEVTFQGQYPVSRVRYSDPASPVSVEMTAYSPFIPLSIEDSSLPVVMCEFVLLNTGDAPIDAEFGGWLQNGARHYSASTVPGERVNTIESNENASYLACQYRENSPVDTKDGDEGTMTLALIGGGRGKADATPETLFSAPEAELSRKPASDLLIGGLTQSLRLMPGVPQTVVFAVAWHFPHASEAVADAASGNHYARLFADAGEVARYVVREHSRLRQDTMLWHETWYDSTLPHWFLDRTFINTSTLATSTSHRYATGRFWGWEGVGCCEGTCTHVWHYAQAIGRLFPEIERDMRERVDFGAAFDLDSGKVGYRGENTGPAVDGQCGRILGVYREHQMSADDAFLRRLWPNVRKAMDWVSHHDTDGDGLLEGAQENTLDAAWYGKIPWISSLYAAALRACEAMAQEMGDTSLAAQYAGKLAQTRHAIETQLFKEEYFIQLPEAGHENSLGVYETCHIDQVQGQSWAWQVGLGRVLDKDKTVSALRSLYKYNFAPDVGPYREKNTLGRNYALAGEAGLIMATNPRELPEPFGAVGWQTMYFNECMSGFEHQAASHMIVEGMVLEGLAVTRAIHDRYHAARRNPYNEIECSDHYARAMASYGSFVTICGFEYHGPKGYMGFAPRMTPERFRAPFTAAEGWGTFSQEVVGNTMDACVTLRHGHLRLNTLALSLPSGVSVETVTVTCAGQHVDAGHEVLTDGRLQITLRGAVAVTSGQAVSIHIGPA